MAILVVMQLVAILAAILPPSASMALYDNCYSDRDCQDANTYCYDSGKCVRCTDCSVYNRNPGNGCAKTKHQCGSCFSGMSADTNLDGTLSVCRPTSTRPPDLPSSPESNPEADPQPETDNYNLYIFIAIGFIIAAAFGVICYLGIRNTTCSTDPREFMRSFRSDCPMPSGGIAPPPYSEKHPTAPPDEARDGPGGASYYIRNESPIEVDTSQTTSPFANPNWVRGGDLASNDTRDDEDEPDEGEALMNPTIPHPDDEETQPSAWTPEPNSTGATPRFNSFSDVFRQMNITQVAGSRNEVQTSSRSDGELNAYTAPQNTSNNQQDQSFPNSASAQQINITVGVQISNTNQVYNT